MPYEINFMDSAPDIKCPKCSSTQITANKKGFSGTKAVGGALLTGGIGLLAGTIGSNKVVITCLNCGHKWKPGDTNKTVVEPQTKVPPTKQESLFGCVLVLIVIAAILFYSC